MRTLTPTERRAFRAKAHHLHPFVSIGQHGLTPAVLHEIDINLLAHELIKIRVFSDDRGERDALFARICAELDAAPIQHLGKILTIWRPAPEPEAAVVLAKPRSKPTSGAGKRPQAKAREKAASAVGKRRQGQPQGDTASGMGKRRQGQPHGEAASGASNRRRAQPRIDQPKPHYRAAPAAPRGTSAGTAPAGARSRRRKAGPPGVGGAKAVEPPRARRRRPS